MNLQVKKNLFSVLAFVGAIWAVYLINLPLSVANFDLNGFGLEPRTVHGLIGIFTMPFLHHGLNHLLGNTVPLVVLLLMLAFTRPNPKRVIICLTVISGMMLWVLGRDDIHVGASGLIYSLAAYLMAIGFFERKIASIIVAVLVVVLYGSLFWGLFPSVDRTISWESHVLAAIAGGFFAAQTSGRLRRKPQQSRTITESPITSDSTHQI